MGKRGPKPADKQGGTVPVHCPAEVIEDLEDASYTRNKSRSFIAAEAIRLGLPLVRDQMPAVRGPKPAVKKKAAE